jgi:hypothetical protein
VDCCYVASYAVLRSNAVNDLVLFERPEAYGVEAS